MSFTMSGLMSSLLFSSVGYYVARYGFKRQNYVEAAIGLALMFYTYFTTSPTGDWGVGFILCGAAYYFRY